MVHILFLPPISQFLPTLLLHASRLLKQELKIINESYWSLYNNNNNNYNNSNFYDNKNNKMIPEIVECLLEVDAVVCVAIYLFSLYNLQ